MRGAKGPMLKTGGSQVGIAGPCKPLCPHFLTHTCSGSVLFLINQRNPAAQKTENRRMRGAKGPMLKTGGSQVGITGPCKPLCPHFLTHTCSGSVLHLLFYHQNRSSKKAQHQNLKLEISSHLNNSIFYGLIDKKV